MCQLLTYWDTKFRICEGKALRFDKRSKKWNRIDNKHNKRYIHVHLTNNEGKRKHFNLHRIVYKAYHPNWDIMNGITDNSIDHIDGNKLNNNIDNLRVVTNQENQFNRTKAKGYYFNKNTNKWRARLQLDGKNIHIGYYDTEEEAHQSYLTAKENIHIIKER